MKIYTVTFNILINHSIISESLCHSLFPFVIPNINNQISYTYIYIYIYISQINLYYSLSYIYLSNTYINWHYSIEQQHPLDLSLLSAVAGSLAPVSVLSSFALYSFKFKSVSYHIKLSQVVYDCI